MNSKSCYASDVPLKDQLIMWRHHLHQHPETGFNEIQTSDYIANILTSIGLEVHRNIGGTGIVANLKVGTSSRAIAIRADMDALEITENVPGRPWKSRNPGKMHACGHDGHMAMVLGAAHILAATRNFDGTVRFIFQPDEEHGRGAKAMIDDGLFKRFPVDAIFGAHNMPGLPAGNFATRSGGIMASEDTFSIVIRGRGTHAARPHMGSDPIVIGSQIVLALQTIVSRNIDPSLSAVISCTEFISDGLRNVIPTTITIKGDTRSYQPEVQTLIETRMREISESICKMNGAECDFVYKREFVPTINSDDIVSTAISAAINIAGIDKVDDNVQPMMISEDFGAFLQEVKGNFIFIGNGHSEQCGSIPLHNPEYDFNDDILESGSRYFAELINISLGDKNKPATLNSR